MNGEDKHQVALDSGVTKNKTTAVTDSSTPPTRPTRLTGGKEAQGSTTLINYTSQMTRP